MLQEIIRLEYHRRAAAQIQDIRPGGPCRIHSDIVENDLSFVGRLQKIDRAEKRRFPGSAGTDDAYDLTVLHFQIDTAQHMILSE